MPIALLVSSMLSGHAISNEPDADKVSVLVSTNHQDVVDSVMEPATEVQASNSPVLDGPVTEGSIVTQETQRVPSTNLPPAEPVILAEPYASPVTVADACCTTCYQIKCCCRKVPTTANFCLIDPDGCEVEFCAKVPACCVGHQPQVSWRCGILGRKVATRCWDCCNDTVKVVVTRRGKVRVRD